jgi:hypothetical protein
MVGRGGEVVEQILELRDLKGLRKCGGVNGRTYEHKLAISALSLLKIVLTKHYNLTMILILT